MTLRERIREFAYGRNFESFILAVIILNSFVIGAKTYTTAPILFYIDKVCVAIFVFEIIIKFIGRKSLSDYARDGWNWFDIIVVAGAFIPATNGLSTALRILRVFRVLRLIRFIPELSLIANVLLRSLRSMAYVSLLMLILAYIYAVIGVELFGDYMFEYATLHEAFFSLFRSLTLEDWTDLRYAGLKYQNYWVVTIYHVSWVVLATFVMLNLLIGAILNNYTLVKEAERRRRYEESHGEGTATDDMRVRELLREIEDILSRRSVG